MNVVVVVERCLGWAGAARRGRRTERMKRTATNELDQLLKKAAQRKEKIKAADEAIAAAEAERLAVKEEAPAAAVEPAPSEAAAPAADGQSDEPTTIPSVFTLPASPCGVVALVAEGASECASQCICTQHSFFLAGHAHSHIDWVIALLLAVLCSPCSPASIRRMTR